MVLMHRVMPNGEKVIEALFSIPEHEGVQCFFIRLHQCEDCSSHYTDGVEAEHYVSMWVGYGSYFFQLLNAGKNKKSVSVKCLFGRLRQHENYSNTCHISLDRPVSGSTNGMMVQVGSVCQLWHMNVCYASLTTSTPPIFVYNIQQSFWQKYSSFFSSKYFFLKLILTLQRLCHQLHIWRKWNFENKPTEGSHFQYPIQVEAARAHVLWTKLLL